jgi:hypothetical protein
LEESTELLGLDHERQREALQMTFGGQAGGFPAQFAEFIGEVRGVEFVPIEFEVADDLAYWRAEIPGKVVASAGAPRVAPASYLSGRC